jgi:hypothetical protein
MERCQGHHSYFTAQDQVRYKTARLASKPEIKTPAPADISADTVLTTARQAKLAREQAEIARRRAEAAIQKAHQVKTETDTFLEPWRDKKRIKKSNRQQIESRIKKANQIIAKAKHLIDSANEAEQRAQAAEENAQRIQDQFVQAHREIITN